MRRLALLAPLLLSGCVLLGPGVPPRRILPPPPSGGIPHDGYVLICEGLSIPRCAQRADRLATASGRGRSIRWIIVRPDGHELCWEGTVAAICEMGGTPTDAP